MRSSPARNGSRIWATYPDIGFRFFAIEIDRNTESIDSPKAVANTFGKKIDGYLAVFKNKTFKDRWGLPNLMLLTVTTSVTHMANIIDHLAKQKSPYADRFLFKALPSFGTNWQVPKALLAELLSEPWRRVGEPFRIDGA